MEPRKSPVEVFTLSRYYIKQGKKKNGLIRHYIATKEDALSDYFFYLSNAFMVQETWSPISMRRDWRWIKEGNVLVSYSDSNPTSSTPTELYYLYGAQTLGKTIVRDGVTSDVLPYSGQKISESIIAALKQ